VDYMLLTLDVYSSSGLFIYEINDIFNYVVFGGLGSITRKCHSSVVLTVSLMFSYNRFGQLRMILTRLALIAIIDFSNRQDYLERRNLRFRLMKKRRKPLLIKQRRNKMSLLEVNKIDKELWAG